MAHHLSRVAFEAIARGIPGDDGGSTMVDEPVKAPKRHERSIPRTALDDQAFDIGLATTEGRC